MSILVIIPTRADCPAELAYRSFQAEQAMREKCGHVDIVRVFLDPDMPVGVSELLGDQHSHVMTIPDNVVVYDPLLPGLLVQKKADAVVVPQIKPQGVKGDDGDGLIPITLESVCGVCRLEPRGVYAAIGPVDTYCDMSITVWTHNPDMVEKVADEGS